MEFIDQLIEMRNGGVAIELQEALEKVVTAVRETGKASKLVLTLHVNPVDKQMPVDKVFVRDEIKTVLPKTQVKATLFFVKDNGHLTRNNEEQLEIFDGTRKEVKK